MAERISKTQRWLDLIAFLVGRKVPVEVEQIMEAVPAYAGKYLEGDEKARETVRRMFERDKDELRGLGIPIETVPLTLHYGAETVDAYRLAARDFYLPYLRLIREERGEGAGPGTGARKWAAPAPEPSPLQQAKYGVFEIASDDAAAAREALDRVADLPAFPLRREARSALRKLCFDLGPAPPEGPPSVLYVDRSDGEEMRARVRTLSDALLARKRVRFTYHGIERGVATERDVAPYGLLFQHGQWYLVGDDATRDDIRVFRVGRMENLQPNRTSPRTPDYEIPPDFSLDAYRNRQAWELGSEEEPTIEARVRFAFPTCLWADRNGYGTLIEEGSDGSQLRGFEVRQVSPFLRWILSLEGKARIEAPPALIDELRHLACETLAVYETSGAGPEPGAGEGEPDG